MCMPTDTCFSVQHVQLLAYFYWTLIWVVIGEWQGIENTYVFKLTVGTALRKILFHYGITGSLSYDKHHILLCSSCYKVQIYTLP